MTNMPQKRNKGLLLYLHGFASCGDSNKTRLLKSYFGQTAVLAPDLPVAPDEALTFIETLLQRHDVTGLIGSSLGGFYATHFSERFGIPVVLLNPSVHPDRTLAPYVGTNRFWCSGKPFEWKNRYLKQLASMKLTAMKCHAPKLILLQSGDEVLDYRIAQKAYADCEIIVETGGNHRFENLQDYLERIEAFFTQS